MSPNTFSKAKKERIAKQLILQVSECYKNEQVDHRLFFINPQSILAGDAKKFFKHVLQIHPGYKDGEAKKDGA